MGDIGGGKGGRHGGGGTENGERNGEAHWCSGFFCGGDWGGRVVVGAGRDWAESIRRTMRANLAVSPSVFTGI